METMMAQDLKSRIESGQAPKLLDVRTPAEFNAYHVDGAINVPLDQLTPERVRAAGISANEVVGILCQRGGRASQATAKLSAAGFRAICVDGGTLACKDAGVPLVSTAKEVISIERQVRIGAGALVVVGVILGSVVSPGFYGLSGFVGAGLIFAGVTDWCGVGILLSKMPWNR